MPEQDIFETTPDSTIPVPIETINTVGYAKNVISRMQATIAALLTQARKKEAAFTSHLSTLLGKLEDKKTTNAHVIAHVKSIQAIGGLDDLHDALLSPASGGDTPAASAVKTGESLAEPVQPEQVEVKGTEDSPEIHVEDEELPAETEPVEENTAPTVEEDKGTIPTENTGT